MTTEFGPKQPSEAYFVAFDFTTDLGAETIASATTVAIDQFDSSNVTATVLNGALQTNTTTVVNVWVRAGTTGHRYLITCDIVGSLGSIYELDGILPVDEIPSAGIVSGGGLVTAPIIEPITLAELKLHLRIDSGSFADNVDETQSIAPGSHVITAGYALVGSSVEALGYTALVSLASGTNAATGTVDVKIQESDDNTAWTDWTGGAFTQVTTANDNLTYEKAYTGTKRYIRTVAKVLLAACEFGTIIIRLTATSVEDDLLNALIVTAREQVEYLTQRKLLTQTWDYSLDSWPCEDYIRLPYGNLQTVSSVKWKDTDGVETTLAAGTDYLVETNGTQCGRIILPYMKYWPVGILYPSNPITIRFVCGWTTAALIPYRIKAAVKMFASKLYESRGEDILGQTVSENKVIDMLLISARLWDFSV